MAASAKVSYRHPKQRRLLLVAQASVPLHNRLLRLPEREKLHMRAPIRFAGYGNWTVDLERTEVRGRKGNYDGL
jgi:hypothetical protein